jgi:hypothetical protein
VSCALRTCSSENSEESGLVRPRLSGKLARLVCSEMISLLLRLLFGSVLFGLSGSITTEGIRSLLLLPLRDHVHQLTWTTKRSIAISTNFNPSSICVLRPLLQRRTRTHSRPA